MLEPASFCELSNFCTELLIRVSDIAKKKLPHETVGEPIFLATPFFRRSKKMPFFLSINMGMWGIYIGVFDAAESIPEVYLAVEQIVLAISINCTKPIFWCRDCWKMHFSHFYLYIHVGYLNRSFWCHCINSWGLYRL